MDSLAKRLKYARLLREMTQQSLAEKAGVKQSDISKIERGDILKTTSLSTLSRALSVQIDWLDIGDGPMQTYTVQEPVAPYNVTPIEPRGKVPVISWVQAGDWCDAADPHPAGSGDEWLDCPMRHSKATYALRVRGSSMYNPAGDRSFSEGDILFIDPEREPQHRSLVICRLDGSGEATFKRLLIEGDQRMLEALNPAWPEKIIKIDASATICGVVIGKVESY